MKALIDLVTPAVSPALYALLHRCGLPRPTVPQQQQARDELWSALTEAYKLGRQSVHADGVPCWHCGDRLDPDPPRCESCPDECDVEDCDAPGCREEAGR